MDEIIVRIGKLIREKRLIKGYSTQELADLIGVSAGLINNIENARNDTFNLELLSKLCSALDIPFISVFPINTKEFKEIILSNQLNSTDIQEQINNLISNYINAAEKLKYNPLKLNKLLEKLIYEIEFFINTQ
ncbi:helix-turn-helix domain-containing protein [Caloramator australicus]|uniref:Putative transcriptional regulator n=1 Tax=Caloramator australicus RC3 TaxID=857293 RepID=I7LGT0_9CLOT|nr:helix-turn-helix transcriptional regulator [Caloramator australicus]CCJ33520.1 putative transcriptional regulator [Caloramator australicus RC3]